LAWRSAKHQNTEVTPTSTRDNSSNMDPMELAVRVMEAQGEREQLSYIKVAEKYNVSRHTGQKMQGHSSPSLSQGNQQRKLNPQ
jgi:hypothetical protein